MNDALENAASYSDLVRKSTRYGMLTFHRDTIQQTIEEVGSRKEIEGLRIFDSMGKAPKAMVPRSPFISRTRAKKNPSR